MSDLLHAAVGRRLGGSDADAPSVACGALAWIDVVAPDHMLFHEDLGAPHARRGLDPWLHSAAGLAVFLI